MFALWYLSLAVDEIRKRLGCSSHLWSKPNAQTIPQAAGSSKSKETGLDAIIAPSPEPPKKPTDDKPVAKAPSTPLKPVDPIQIPKENPNEERLKQLESPETAELIKTFEITDPLNGGEGNNGSPKAKSPTPEPPVPVVSPIVAVKPQPVVAPSPVVAPKKEQVPSDPSSLFGPPPATSQAATKDIKEATSDFLAQEFSQPKKSSKRYTKSRQKNNHS